VGYSARERRVGVVWAIALERERLRDLVAATNSSSMWESCVVAGI